MWRLFKRTAPAAFLLVACSALNATSAAGAGLKTTFVRASLENLRIGHTYNIREMANLPLAVYNTGDEPTGLVIEPTVPIEGETRQGYEPIPDVSWITISCDSFASLEAGALGMADVMITIPDDVTYAGKRYQAMIWSHTVGQGLVACGLKSEVLFTTSADREEPAAALTMLPTEIITDSESTLGPVQVKIFNPFDRTRQISLASIPASASPIHLRQDYEAADPSLLAVGQETVSIPGKGDVSVEIRVGHASRGRLAPGRYAFVLAMTETGSASPAGWTAIYVTVKE